MKKDRNSFFQEYGMNAYNTTMPMMPGVPNQIPQQVQSNSSFYAGPVPNTGLSNFQNINDNYTNEIESRFSKIERQINRLESRINRLEGEMPTNFNTTTTTTTESDYNYPNSSMYMV